MPRVSTHDQQTLPMQMRAMREYASKRGWEIAVQIKEVGSGAVERELRAKLMAAARRREIDVVLVWRLDRWGRSLADLVVTLKELSELGVDFVSLTEALDLTTPTGRAMAGLLSVFSDNAESAIMQSYSAEPAVPRYLQISVAVAVVPSHLHMATFRLMFGAGSNRGS
jgi:DNA invertase Pin-like site-specific DNA recombinase